MFTSKSLTGLVCHLVLDDNVQVTFRAIFFKQLLVVTENNTHENSKSELKPKQTAPNKCRGSTQNN